MASELRAGWFTAMTGHQGVQASIHPTRHQPGQACRPVVQGRLARHPQEANRVPLELQKASPLAQSVKSPPAMQRPGLIPGSGRASGEENGYPLQYSCLENPRDRRTWQATVHRVSRVEHDLSTKPPPPTAVELETSQLFKH